MPLAGESFREPLAMLRKHARRIFEAGLASVDPHRCVKRFCRREGDTFTVDGTAYDLTGVERVVVVGCGKASAPMAAALENMLGDRIREGRVTVKHGHGAKLKRILVTEAGHPVPDADGMGNAVAIMETARRCGEKDLLICLISGGGSALMPLPADGLTLEDKQRSIEVMMACGATIHEINALRKHTSGIKGGRLAAAAHPARLVTLMLSDVVGDDTDVIASGPTVPDASSYADCLEIIRRYRIRERLPRSVVGHLEAGAAGRREETPPAEDPAFSRTQNVVVGRNLDAIRACAASARSLGFEPLVLSSRIEGETREVARMHGAVAREVLASGLPLPPPCCVLSGGETTVRVTGSGKGGRNQEFALAAAMDIAGAGPLVVLSGGTDGTDGPTDAAGAVADGETVRRATALGLSPRRHLEDNDAYPFFQVLGDLLVTGPTRTNVMDLRVILAGVPGKRQRTA
jgi:hydroxypyruvate reductase